MTMAQSKQKDEKKREKEMSREAVVRRWIAEATPRKARASISKKEILRSSSGRSSSSKIENSFSSTLADSRLLPLSERDLSSHKAGDGTPGLAAQWLYQHLRHSRLPALEGVLRGAVHRKPNDGHLGVPREAPNLPRGVHAVQHGHHNVHQDNGIAALLCKFNRFHPVERTVHFRQPHVRKLPQKKSVVYGMIFGQKYFELLLSGRCTSRHRLIHLGTRRVGDRRHASAAERAHSDSEIVFGITAQTTHSRSFQLMHIASQPGSSTDTNTTEGTISLRAERLITYTPMYRSMSVTARHRISSLSITRAEVVTQPV
eukprot:RCo043458